MWVSFSLFFSLACLQRLRHYSLLRTFMDYKNSVSVSNASEVRKTLSFSLHVADIFFISFHFITCGECRDCHGRGRGGGKQNDSA